MNEGYSSLNLVNKGWVRVRVARKPGREVAEEFHNLHTSSA